MKFNINDYVFVKLTDRGREIHRIHYERVFPDHPDIVYQEPEVDADGESKFQLWDLMTIFGEHMYLGCNPPIETDINIPTVTP